MPWTYHGSAKATLYYTLGTPWWYVTILGKQTPFWGLFIYHKPHALRQINVKSAQCLLGTCFIDRTLCKHALGAKRGTPRGYVRRRARLRTKIPGGNLECAAIVVFLPAYGEGAHSLTFFQPKKINSRPQINVTATPHGQSVASTALNMNSKKLRARVMN